MNANRLTKTFQRYVGAFARTRFTRTLASTPPLTLAIFLLAALSSPISAKIPEPDTVFFGRVRHNGGDLLLPASNGDFSLIARLNGVTIAQTPLTANSSSFRLNIPMDDGQAPRLTGTAVAGERIKVYLRINASSEEHEVLSSVGLGVPLPTGDRGIIQEGDMTVAAHVGGIAEGFWAWSMSYNLSGLPGDDSDGDGVSDADEFVAQTDPTNPTDSFRIMEVRRVNDVTSVRFGPIRLSRRYSIWYSTRLGTGNWSKLTDIHPNQAAAWRWYDHATPLENVFYKLSVEVQ